MKTTTINNAVIEHLRKLADNNEIRLEQTKHLRLTGVYNGKKRTFFLCCSPSSSYQKTMRSTLRRFLRSLDIETNLSPIF